jgi:hypothetical protein
MYGIKPGTQLWITCNTQQSNQRTQRQVAQNQAVAAAFVGAAVLGVAAVAVSNSGPYYHHTRYRWATTAATTTECRAPASKQIANTCLRSTAGVVRGAAG